jgi:hypothetical protein
MCTLFLSGEQDGIVGSHQRTLISGCLNTLWQTGVIFPPKYLIEFTSEVFQAWGFLCGKYFFKMALLKYNLYVVKFACVKCIGQGVWSAALAVWFPCTSLQSASSVLQEVTDPLPVVVVFFLQRFT